MMKHLDNILVQPIKMYGSFSYLEVGRHAAGDAIFINAGSRASFETIAIGVARIFFIGVDDIE